MGKREFIAVEPGGYGLDGNRFTGMIMYGENEGVVRNAAFYLKEVNGKKMVGWEDGNWEDGTWSDGMFVNGTWKKGTWNGGLFYNGVWEDGTWNGGMWMGGGTWLGGTDASGKLQVGCCAGK